MSDKKVHTPNPLEEAEKLTGRSEQELFGIGDLAEEYEISTRSIRFYESKGLIEPQRVNGVRIYNRKDRARLALILRGKAIGSSLSEIKHFLDLYGQHGEGHRQQTEYLASRTDEVLKELSARKEALEVTIAEIQSIHDECMDKLSQA
ncbi:Mercuric resistance operon regulatory protein [Pseudovibrio axinellae]|uniref:Mercuric resistance operon regulatory protein n=1 Tax=Pseudovibrio axinellae TaxID=989403 RepID=A0A165XJS5_9HYPH|nr:MerR family DNA-binding transcriptional regulator [Pseudovibrio axinellae]KZL17774.1 Mercuric resistance operon regulatory protein [Pseudovibrio axinellae]SEP73141.1 DNA-binding transcriptional regulator, MerR family [Pseudovibrio axinellae]